MVKQARGHLYAFHRMSGSADLALQDAVRQLRSACYVDLADDMDQALVGDAEPHVYAAEMKGRGQSS